MQVSPGVWPCSNSVGLKQADLQAPGIVVPAWSMLVVSRWYCQELDNVTKHVFAEQADLRAPDGDVPAWKLSADCEALAWAPHAPTQFVASSEDGLVACFDARAGAGAAPLFRLAAHDKPACALAFSATAAGLLATASTDKKARAQACRYQLKICTFMGWRVNGSVCFMLIGGAYASCVHSVRPLLVGCMHMGKICSVCVSRQPSKSACKGHAGEGMGRQWLRAGAASGAGPACWRSVLGRLQRGLASTTGRRGSARNGRRVGYTDSRARNRAFWEAAGRRRAGRCCAAAA